MAEPFNISVKETAALLGKSVDWFRSNREMLEETTGFPVIDPVLKMYNLQSLKDWQEKRAKQLQDKATGQSNQPTERGNAHAF